MAYDFKFPDVGEGITEGEIVKWLVKEGDEVKADQPIAEVETDKAVVELPAPESGTILSILHREGETIKVGEVLVRIGNKGEATKVKKKREDKGSVMGVLEEAPEEERKETVETRKEARKIREELGVKEEGLPGVQAGKGALPKVLATPAVRRVAQRLGVDISSITPSGPGGRIMERDVENAARERVKPSERVEEEWIPKKEGETEERAITKAEASPKVVRKYDLYGYIDRVPLKGVRKTIAKHMLEAVRNAAQVTEMDDVDVTELWDVRKRAGEEAEREGVKLTFIPFIIKACVHALRANPRMNSTIEGDEIIIKKYYNIGVATATEEGLLVPVVKGADQKSVLDLAKELAALVDKARKRTIDLADLRGGTFTITNWGSIGGTYGTPILNYPECAILGLGRISDRPWVIEGKIAIRKIMPISVTFDHRIVDGAIATKFMNDLKERLEDPELLFLSR